MERIVEVELGSEWDPNGEQPTRMTVSEGVCELRLGPHPDDSDDRDVVLRFTGVRHASLGSPNDEARPTHRLWDFGLSSVVWAGIVHNSEFVAAINNASARPTSLTHWVVPLKEETAEVVATRCELGRI